MRYAVTADLHGRRKSWRRVREGAALAGIDRLVVLGDYLEAKVPWRHHDPSRRYDPDSVVKHDPELWEALAAEADLVLGNQEWRIRDLLRPDQVPAALVPLLRAPERISLGAATGIHGHQLRWHETVRGDQSGGAGNRGLEPDATALPPAEGILLAGHSHRTQLLEITWIGSPDDAEAKAESVRRVPVRPSVPIDVSPFAGPRRPDSPDGRWSTLFVNVGPALGKPSRWLLYDDERQQITFNEAYSTHSAPIEA